MTCEEKRETNIGIYRVGLAVFTVALLSLTIVGISIAEARPASDEGRIVFVKENMGLWVMDADGRNEKQLTTKYDVYPAWSPDGRQIAFTRYDKDGDETAYIYIINADGSNMRRLTNGGFDYHATWSPDGKRIAFDKQVWKKKDGVWEIESGGIYVIDLDGTNLRRLTHEKRDEDPDWSPDGENIVFYLYGMDVRPSQIWVIDADGNNRKMLYDWGYLPDWSPDGERIAFHSRRAGWDPWKSMDIYIMDANGKNVRTLTNPDPSHDGYPTWSPDGTKIAFASNRGANLDIYVMDADGSNVRQLTNTPEREFECDWTASSYAVKPAGKLTSTWGQIKQH